MTIFGFPAKMLEADACGHFLTFVVPAVSGCDLRCSYCIVDQRREIGAGQPVLQPDDYVSYIRKAAACSNVLGISLQGYEPLLPGTMPYTKAIINACGELGVPVGMVTNGTHLCEAMPELIRSAPDKIGVSLDAVAPERHDRLRGVTGAWERSVKGIQEGLARLPDGGRRMAVLSTFMPGKRAYVEGMPALLSGLGVSEWIVNPLVNLAKNPWADPARRERLIEDLNILTDASARYGIDFIVDDELGALKSSLAGSEEKRVVALPIRTMPKGVVLSRLAPGGHLSVGMDIMRPLASSTNIWRPDSGDAATVLAASKAAAAGGLAMAA